MNSNARRAQFAGRLEARPRVASSDTPWLRKLWAEWNKFGLPPLLPALRR